MDLEQIKELVDSAESSTSATREEASDMLVFGRINQWDDEIGSAVRTKYRGQFDLIKPKRNRILSELWANPVSVSFEPQDGADPESAEVLQGMFRADMHDAEEAIETALQDQLDGGFGAYRFVTEYESKFDDLNNYQRIKAIPINEANNTVYWDDNCKQKDKGDARWCLIITSFTEQGYKDFAKSVGVDPDIKPSSFKNPNTTNTWFWRNNTKEIHIGEFYHREQKRERVLIYEDPLGETRAVYQKEIKKVEDELIELGFTKIGEKMKDRWVVNKYIVSGEKILKKQRIAGEYIPIVPIYGDWSFVEGREIWRGIYWDAQDPQRLHNFLMSYTADIVAQGPREKPIFDPNQIEGFEWMYHENGADNNLPYYLAKSKDEDGNPYPQGPSGGYMKNPELPQSNAALMGYTRQSVDDVTGGTMNLDSMMSGQVTEGQVNAAMKSQNMETFLYQNNFALAQKQAGRIYSSMASEIYDTPREVSVRLPDGTEKTEMIMESVLDYETGEEVVLNDLTQGSFKVFADVGPAYSTQKDEARANFKDMYIATQGTPEGQMMLLTYLSLMDGPDTKHIRDYARKQMILAGYIEPETDEEMMMVQQAQQAAQQPDPNMLLAQAEMEKAKADQMDATNDQAKLQVDAYNAETKRIETMSKIPKTQAETEKLASEIKGNELDSLGKLANAFIPQSMRIQ